MSEMTETEFATTVEALGIQKGRLQVAMELSQFAVNYPAVQVSTIAHEFAKAIVERCEQVIEETYVERHPDS